MPTTSVEPRMRGRRRAHRTSHAGRRMCAWGLEKYIVVAATH
jgi:aminoglycoside N3'-acetyltransferase